MSDCRQLNGFTLIEILIAVLLGSMVAVTGLISVRQMLQNRRLLENFSELNAQGRYAVQCLRRDLSNLYRGGWANQVQFRGGLTGFSDSLNGLVVHSDPYAPAPNPGDLLAVNYRLETHTDGSVRLLRIVRGLEPGAVAKAMVVAGPLASFKMLFWDGAAWLDQWTDAVRLPAMIQIQLEIRSAENPLNTVTLCDLVSLEPLTDNTLIAPEPELEDTVDVEINADAAINPNVNSNIVEP